MSNRTRRIIVLFMGTGPNPSTINNIARIVLIDGEQLAEFMIDHGVGVTDHKTYTVKKLDSDYFDGV